MSKPDMKNWLSIIHAAELFAKLTGREQQYMIEQMKSLLSKR